MDDETEIFHVTKFRQKFMDDEEGRAALRAYRHNVFDHGLFTHVSAMEKIWAKAVMAGNPSMRTLMCTPEYRDMYI